MNHLLIAVLLAMLVPQNQNLPEKYYQIPEPIRETATIVVTGTYSQGRTPCMFMADGTRRWGLDSHFVINRVYRGKVGSKLISINRVMLPETEYVTRRLELKQEYLVLLKPAQETMKKISSKEGNSFWDALRGEEIIAIVELK